MPGSTIAWPTADEFLPSRVTWGVITSRTAWSAPYTGQTQSVTHLADRLRITLELPSVREALAGGREAYLMGAGSAGNWILMGHLQRPTPLGTLRGTPVAAAAAAAGAHEISITTTAGATLLAGDVLGVASQLIQCAYGGAVADGSGHMTLPLVLPLRRAVALGATFSWDRPTGTFQVLNLDPIFDYSSARRQMGLTVELAEVYT
jgi:hypothetical protein